jgi:hypothetical protein
MMMAFTYLPGFVTMVFRGMPTVWRGRHRLLLCWLVFMQAVSPGRKTLEEMARWTPATITAWRFGDPQKGTCDTTRQALFPYHTKLCTAVHL